LPEVILEDYPSLKDYQVLISGPIKMVKDAKVLFTKGLKKSHLFSDWFDFENNGTN
jgi:hypothetical protein